MDWFEGIGLNKVGWIGKERNGMDGWDAVDRYMMVQKLPGDPGGGGCQLGS